MKSNTPYRAKFGRGHYLDTLSKIDRQQWLKKFTNYLYVIGLLESPDQETRERELAKILLELVFINFKERLHADSDHVDDVFRIWQKHIVEIPSEYRMTFATNISSQEELEVKDLFQVLYETDFTDSGFFKEFRLEVRLMDFKVSEPESVAG